MVELRSAAREPRFADLALVVLGSLVAHQLEGVLTFDQCLALGNESFKLNRLHLTAVLFTLGALLGLLVVVQLVPDPRGGSVKDVDSRPEQIVEVRFEARVLQGHDQGVEDIGDGPRDRVAVRQEPLIGFVGEGPIAMKLQFVEDMVGR